MAKDWKNLLAKKPLTDKDLKLRMVTAINQMAKILVDEDESSNTKAYVSNTLAGLVKRYKEEFNVAPEKDSDVKLKSVKNF